LAAPAPHPVSRIAAHDLTRDEACLVGCEKEAQRHDIFGRAVQIEELPRLDAAICFRRQMFPGPGSQIFS
ncbi:MAG: hypothetical protein WCE20_16830, partial [Rhizomicrobium sp.]